MRATGWLLNPKIKRAQNEPVEPPAPLRNGTAERPIPCAVSEGNMRVAVLTR
jgi:hypothetical protein